MRQAIRALGLAIYVVWLVMVVFTISLVYSAFQLGVSFGEQRTSTSGGTMTLSLPFSMQNNGFYDISNLNITTIIQETNGALVTNSSTLVTSISSSKKVDITHNISISLDEMTRASLSRLLFNDTDLDVDMSLALTYAGVFPLKISTNSTMTWDAPLSNLNIGNLYSIDSKIVVPTIFENHSLFNLTGTMRLELFNDLNQQVGVETTEINVLSHEDFSKNIEVSVSGPVNVTEVHLSFYTSVFTYEDKVIPIG